MVGPKKQDFLKININKVKNYFIFVECDAINDNSLKMHVHISRLGRAIKKT